MKDLMEIITEAKRLFQNRLKIENPAVPETIAHEVAKKSIPSSSKEILFLALKNLDLALTVPEKGPAFDGTSTAINILAGNLRETVYQALVNPQSPYFSSPKDNTALYAQLLESGGADFEQAYLELLERRLKIFGKTFYTENLYEGSRRSDQD